MSPKSTREGSWLDAVFKGDDFLAENHAILKNIKGSDEAGETSGSSKFNETWPSSEQAPSNVQATIPSSDATITSANSTTPIGKSSRQLVSSWLDKDSAKHEGKPLGNGTLAR